MDWQLVSLMALFTTVIIGVVVCSMAVYVFWKDARLRKIEHQMDGMMNVVEDFMYCMDKETGQLWDYVLSRKPP